MESESKGRMDASPTHPREIDVPRNVMATYFVLFCGGDDNKFSSKGVEIRPGHQGNPITRPQTIVGGEEELVIVV
jgi:hypothetical protein